MEARGPATSSECFTSTLAKPLELSCVTRDTDTSRSRTRTTAAVHWGYRNPKIWHIPDRVNAVTKASASVFALLALVSKQSKPLRIVCKAIAGTQLSRSMLSGRASVWQHSLLSGERCDVGRVVDTQHGRPCISCSVHTTMPPVPFCWPGPRTFEDIAAVSTFTAFGRRFSLLAALPSAPRRQTKHQGAEVEVQTPD